MLHHLVIAFGDHGVYLLFMTEDDLTLFALEANTMNSEPVEVSIRPEQVSRIRQAFEAAGILNQDERKRLVDAAAGRNVTSLRNLTAIEGRRVLRFIMSREAANLRTGGSSWDMRDEDTWIDKL